MKVAASYDARHAKPPAPGAAAVIGTAARAVPASLVIGAAGSAFALSGTAVAAAATVPASVAVSNSAANLSSMANLAALKAAAARTMAAGGQQAAQGRHAARAQTAAAPAAYTVAGGDTLSGISSRFCGTAADYASLAAASGITNPGVIQPGQHVTLDCHHAVPAASPSPASTPSPAPAQPTLAAATSTVGTAGMSAFEACVISAESGGNALAVNPVSGAGGLFQFLPSTWAALGFAGSYPGGAQTAPAGVQEAAFAKLYAQAGTAPWGPYDGC